MAYHSLFEHNGKRDNVSNSINMLFLERLIASSANMPASHSNPFICEVLSPIVTYVRLLLQLNLHYVKETIIPEGSLASMTCWATWCIPPSSAYRVATGDMARHGTIIVTVKQCAERNRTISQSSESK